MRSSEKSVPKLQTNIVIVKHNDVSNGYLSTHISEVLKSFVYFHMCSTLTRTRRCCCFLKENAVLMLENLHCEFTVDVGSLGILLKPFSSQTLCLLFHRSVLSEQSSPTKVTTRSCWCCSILRTVLIKPFKLSWKVRGRQRSTLGIKKLLAFRAFTINSYCSFMTP